MKKIEKIYYETYMFIIDFISKNGYPPTYRELSEGLGCALSTIANRIDVLVKLGRIDIYRRKYRSIKIIG